MLMGLPNTGKSVVFSNLTGKYALSANAPLTTISFTKAPMSIGDQIFEVIDSPGLYSLHSHSSGDHYIRDTIFKEHPDIIIQCIDANRLKQSLLLTVELLTLDIPMVITLNAIDEVNKKGVWIDSIALSRHLGVPVIETISIYGQGMKALKDSIAKARKGNLSIDYGAEIQTQRQSIYNSLSDDIPFKTAYSFLYMLDDTFYQDDQSPDGETLLSKQVTGRKRVLYRIVSHKRNKWVDGVAQDVTKKQQIEKKEWFDTFAYLSRHPVFGVPILLMILYIMFFLVVTVANGIAEWMNTTLWMPVESLLAGLLPIGFWHDFLIGSYGVLSLGLANALLTVLPILSVFFLMFNILEEIGYIPNLSVLTKRILNKLGLSGDSVMPIVLGFGCKTMATLTTRTIKSRREQYIAIYLIAFAIPCAAQMGLNMSILGMMGLKETIITFSVLFFVEIIAGVTLNYMMKADDNKLTFIQELPPIRLPNVKTVIKKTYYRLYWFLKESLSVFIYAAAILFAMDYIGLLDRMKYILSPVIKGFLGLPIQMVDALLLCLARHEAAAAMIINLIREGHLNDIQCIVAVTLTTMLVPCFANIMAISKELGVKKMIGIIIAINSSAIIVSGSLNWMLIHL
nr:magnetosome protein Mad17-1 [Desulfobacteraceae bacterium]